MSEPLLLPAWTQTSVSTDEALARIEQVDAWMQQVADAVQAWAEAIAPAVEQIVEAMQAIANLYWRVIERCGCRAFSDMARLVYRAKRQQIRGVCRLLDWRIAQMGET